MIITTSLPSQFDDDDISLFFSFLLIFYIIIDLSTFFQIFFQIFFWKHRDELFPIELFARGWAGFVTRARRSAAGSIAASHSFKSG